MFLLRQKVHTTNVLLTKMSQPLHWACFYQNLECVALLMEAGADPSIHAGAKKKTAPEIAVERACPPSILNLLQKAQ